MKSGYSLDVEFNYESNKFLLLKFEEAYREISGKYDKS
jgi:hypothetical protein